MRVLVLGGTRFVGRAVARAALDAGWSVTTFNRGISDSDVSGVTVVRGNRASASDLAHLGEQGCFDAVVDLGGYVPREMLAIARLLAPVCDRYVFVSTVSVYAGWPVEPLTEASEVLDGPPDADADYGPPDVEDGPTRYGRLKAGCERAVVEVFGPARATVLRLGVVLGPREYVGRLPYWLRRISVGGTVVAPGDPGRSIQPVDVRDVADFVIHVIARGVSGTFNITAPIGRDTMGGLLQSCAAATGARDALVWVPDERLLAAGVRQWSELPLWRTHGGVWRVDSSAALAAGLRCRSQADTVEATWQWLQTAAVDSNERSAEIGLTPGHERILLSGL